MNTTMVFSVYQLHCPAQTIHSVSQQWKNNETVVD